MKRKVLIIVENLPVPFDRRVWKEAVCLQRAGYAVTLLCPRAKEYRKGYEEIDGIRIYRHPMPKEGRTPAGYLWEYFCAFFWECLYAWWIFLRRGFHIIQGCNPPDDVFLIALPFKLFGVRYIFDHHDVNPELYFSKFERKDIFYRVQIALEKLTFRFSDVVISTNNSYKAIAVSRGGMDSKDVIVVRNGPDVASFRAVLPKADLKHGKPYLVAYVGTMNVQEGLDILIDVAEHIHRSGRDDVHFTCAGGGPELETLRKIVAERQLGDFFNFTGRISDADLIQLLSTADLCVNPDRPCEMNDISTMIKIMEYMALGKPIVQFDLKEGRFSAQESALYASWENRTADFAEKILWLLDRPKERQRMGEIGVKRVREELAWEFSVGNLLAAYERALTKTTCKRMPKTDTAETGM